MLHPLFPGLAFGCFIAGKALSWALWLCNSDVFLSLFWITSDVCSLRILLTPHVSLLKFLLHHMVVPAGVCKCFIWVCLHSLYSGAAFHLISFSIDTFFYTFSFKNIFVYVILYEVHFFNTISVTSATIGRLLKSSSASHYKNIKCCKRGIYCK